MKSSLLRFFYHFYQVRRKRRHGHGYHPLQTDNHTTVSRTFHLYKHPLVALEVTTRNTDFRTFTQVHLIGTEEDKMLEEIQKSGKQSNVSMIAFTATPKPDTIQLFGTLNAEGKKESFDLYSMKQTSLDKGTQRKTTENELPSLTKCTA